MLSVTHNRLYIRAKFAQSEGMSADPAQLLRQRGFKVTAQRLAVLRAVSERPHLTADDVVGLVRADIGTISTRAVYDAVGVLADLGLLRRIQPAGSPARYEASNARRTRFWPLAGCFVHGITSAPTLKYVRAR